MIARSRRLGTLITAFDHIALQARHGNCTLSARALHIRRPLSKAKPRFNFDMKRMNDTVDNKLEERSADLPGHGESEGVGLKHESLENSETRSAADPDNGQPRVKRRKVKPPKPLVVAKNSVDGYLMYDVIDLRNSLNMASPINETKDKLSFQLAPLGPQERRTAEVSIMKLGSGGDGIGIYEHDDGTREVVVVPFTVPGDVVKANIYKKHELYSVADYIELLSAGESRDDSLIRCKYFAKCAGCQLQMIPYEEQLRHKREVIVRAYRHFCDTPAGTLPEIQDTIGSPLQYGYRTKLTPHFDLPRKKPVTVDVPIGFTQKGRPSVLDIEECPIATPAINETYKKERQRVSEETHLYKRGATLLLREGVEGDSRETVVITDSKKNITEFVGDFKFTYPAGDFFQCNSSVLPLVTQFINSQVKAPYTTADGQTATPKHLVDAYCGSGLFSITCSESVGKVIGVEIAPRSVVCASANAKSNNVTNAEFVLGNAEVIFNKITTDAKETAMILDPPRKGCDKIFLDQLLAYQPRRILYVSCNVHTQARDVSYILNDPRGAKYHVDSIRGFDFFPQTYHVESVAILTYHE